MKKNTQNISINNSNNVVIGAINFDPRNEENENIAKENDLLETQTNLKKLLGDNKADEVISILLSLKISQKSQDEVHLIKGKFNEMYFKERQGLLDHTTIQIEKNNLHYALIQLINML